MMSLFGCEPDKMLSTMISSYAKIGNVDVVSQLYRLAKKEKWKVDNTVFSALIKMYGKSGKYDQCLSVYSDMKVFRIKPNLRTYNNLLRAMGRGKRAWETKAIYEEMINSGISPNHSNPTYRAILLAYCRRMYKVDALNVYKEMKKKGMGIGRFQYHMLLDMCADVGYADEAVEIFQDMKSS
ncbi:pentatricopeptide repeat-containing protein chloroplastic-like, partial [Trifolium medium]|nr:pentatricopeptide repeat-containing protein chloroplastic-like [Trifolium medium]